MFQLITEAAASPTLLEQVMPHLVELAGTLLMGALTWAGVAVKNLIATKVQNEAVKGVLTRLDDAVFAVVKELEQTVAAGLREAAADGKITPEEVAKIKQAALDKVKSYVGPKGLDTALAVLGLKDASALDALISGRVEAAVHDVKAAKETPAVPT